jgi:hypothetical protein
VKSSLFSANCQAPRITHTHTHTHTYAARNEIASSQSLLPRSLHMVAADTRERSLPAGAMLRDSMKSHVTERGLSIVRDSECRKDPVQFVQSLLDLRDKYSAIIDSAFDGDKDFHRALKDVSCVL